MALALQMDETGGHAAPASEVALADAPLNVAWEDLTDRLAHEWDALFALGVASPYQSRRWIQSYMAQVGAAQGDTHAFVTLREESGGLAALFPLVLRQTRLGRVASFIGDKHANFHMPLMMRSLSGSLDARRSHALLRDIGRLLPGLDAFSFFNQPKNWNGAPAPLACLAAWTGSQPVYALDISEGGEASMARVMSKHGRKNLRAKRRRLDDMGSIGLHRACTATEIMTLSSAFAAQKSARFADLGISDPFAAPGMMEFLRDAAKGEDPAVVWHALMLDERPIAIFVGAVDSRRYSGMATSFVADPEIAKYSPGEALLAELITDQADSGRAMFDLGVGEARYKASFCDMVEPVLETVMPLSARGHAILAALQLKRMAKQAGIILQNRNPRLARIARRVLRQGGGG
jgi:CelD/BcsL family acetyltransferase involved in cellulose biosynthesis